MINDYSDLSLQVGRWSVENFGEGAGLSPAAGTGSVLGAVEEFGELMEAFQGTHFDTKEENGRDAAADITIYLADLCYRRDYDFWGCVLKGENTVVPVWAIPVHLGKLCHAILKLSQGIRKDQDHDAEAQKAIGSIVKALCCLWGYDHPQGFLKEIVLPVWEGVVAKRDWKKNNVNGQ